MHTISSCKPGEICLYVYRNHCLINADLGTRVVYEPLSTKWRYREIPSKRLRVMWEEMNALINSPGSPEDG